MAWIAFAIALLAGAANPFQSGTNAELNRRLGQPAIAGLWGYLSGFVGLLLCAGLARQLAGAHWSRAAGAAAGVPWWAWMGGVLSIASTMAGVLFAQKLGSGVFTGLSLSASVVSSVLIDQLGWIGFRQHAASPARLVGCGLLVAGIWLVARF